MAKDLNRSIKIYIDNSDSMKKADALKAKISALDDELTKLNAAGKRETSEYQQKEKALIQLQASYDRYQQKISATEQVLKNLSGASREELEKTRRDIQGTLRKMSRDADGYQDTVKSLIAVEKQLNVVKAEQNGMLGKNATFWSRAADGFNKYFGMLTAFIATITGLSFAFRSLAEDVAKMDDIYADVMKTTGMTKEEVKALNEEFKKWDTRTPREDLNKIAEEGGRIGIAKDKIAEFTKAMDVANVALGDSFTGGVDEVANKLGKLRMLFKETKDEQVEKAYMSIGSAINDLGANGVASEENIADFTTRVGSLPEALKPAIQDALGLGAAFEESGIEAEIGSRAYGIVLNRATTDAGNFGKVMGISKKEVEDLINTNPVEFFLKFSESMKGMNAVDTGKTLDALKINADGANKVIGAAANSTDRFRELLDMSNNSFKTGTSLINEFNIKNNTLAAKLDKSKKDFKEQALILGEKLNPVLLKSTDIVTYIIKLMPGLINFFSEYGVTILYLVSIIGAYTAAVKLNTLWNTNLKTAISLTNIQIKLKAAYMIAAEAATHLYWMAVSILTGRLNDARRSFIAFSAVVKANPWGLALGAIVAVIGAIVLWNNHLGESKTKTDALIDITNEATKSITSEKTEVELLLSVARNESISKAERLKAIKRLNEISPEYLGNLTLENINTQYATDSVKAYTEELLKNAKAKAIQGRMVALDEEILNKQKEIADLEKNKGKAGLSSLLGFDADIYREARKKQLAIDIDNIEKEKQSLAGLNVELIKNSNLKKPTNEKPSGNGGKTGGGHPLSNDKKGKTEAELQKEELDKKLKQLDDSILSEQNKLAQQRLDNKISEDAYNAEMLRITQEAMERKMAILGISPNQQKALLDLTLEYQKKYFLELKGLEEEYRDSGAKYTKEAAEERVKNANSGMKELSQKIAQDTKKQFDKETDRRKRMLELTQSLSDDMGGIIGGAISGNSDLVKSSMQNIVNLGLDLLKTQMEMAIAGATMQSLAQPDSVATFGASGFARAAVMVGLIEAAFAAVKAVVGSAFGGSSSRSSSSSSSSGGSGTYAVNQAAAGKYDVIGQDDGKTYRNVPYSGVATTGVVTVPTLVGEQGTELIVSAPDFSKLQRHINYPLVVQAIKDAQAGTVPQRAQGKYDVIQQTPSSSGGNGQAAQGFDYDRIDKLVDALDKFTNKDLSVNYYSIEKAKTKVETNRSLGKKR